MSILGLSLLVLLIAVNTSVGVRRNDTVDPSISWFIKYTTDTLFDLTKIPQISEKCRSDFGLFLESMDNLELWALKSENWHRQIVTTWLTPKSLLVHDATAKIPSGIFNGNMNQYGDFDQCLNVVAGQKFTGKYCIAYIQPKSKNGLTRDLLKLIQSYEFFKSNFEDVR